jgi:translation initiation factor IF-2
LNLKVYELAKKYDKTNEEIKKALNKLGFEAKSHMTNVSNDIAQKLDVLFHGTQISKPKFVLRKKPDIEKTVVDKIEVKESIETKDVEEPQESEELKNVPKFEPKKIYNNRPPQNNTRFIVKNKKPESDVKFKPTKPKEPIVEIDKLSIKKDNKTFTGPNNVKDISANYGKKKIEHEEEKKLDKIRSLHDQAMSRKKNKKRKKDAFEKEQLIVEQNLLEDRIIKCKSEIVVKDLAEKIGINPTEIVKYLFLKGEIYGVNSFIPFKVAEDVASQYNVLLDLEEEIEQYSNIKIDLKVGEVRAPIVTIMGHVDHGKTSLLDKIRESRVVEKEAGGITQKVSAYQVTKNGKKITFIDTPGHEAFMSMRARGAILTDIAVLVVAADDGVMPQTIEAISHARFANIPIIVAINKIDKKNSDIERVKQGLADHNVLSPEWGGNDEFVKVSALTGEGIADLLETIIVQADIMELKAEKKSPNIRAVVLESRLDPLSGPLADIIVQNGTLKLGDIFLIDDIYGKIRYMIDDQGKRVKEALPSVPVQISGVSEVCNAGSILEVFTNEKIAKKEMSIRKNNKKVSSDIYTTNIDNIKDKEIRLIIKTSSKGSLEAVKSSLLKLNNDESRVVFVQANTGGITQGDIKLASASSSIILAFEVSLNSSLRKEAERSGVEIFSYSVIYNLIEDIENRMKNLNLPELQDKYQGRAEVKEVFKIPGIGSIAGSIVNDGYITRGSNLKVFREDILIYSGKVSSLKRFKNDVKRVDISQDCGIGIENFNDIKVGDAIEAYIEEER